MNKGQVIEAAKAAGATEEQLSELQAATYVAEGTEVILPANRLENLSRGRGWCGYLGRRTKGQFDGFADAVDGGYEADREGRWRVGATDGFSRKRSEDYIVKRIVVGDRTFTIAS